MDAFKHQSVPISVVFGAGTGVQPPADLNRLSRDLVLTTPPQEKQGRDILLSGGRCAVPFAGAAIHVPVEAVDFANERVRALKPRPLATSRG